MTMRRKILVLMVISNKNLQEMSLSMWKMTTMKMIMQMILI